MQSSFLLCDSITSLFPHRCCCQELLLPLTRCLCVSVRFLLDFNLCGLWHSDYFQKKVEALQPCDTAYPGFMYDPSVREANSLIKCGRCQKMFVVQQIPDSNLVLVVTQAYCDCSRQYGAILLEPKEIKYILCNRMKSQKVRRRPQSCHSYHPKENAKDCGGAAAISLSLSLFSASLLVSLVLER
uniref:Voltage-dependent calcium channel alpha-2/delta subunit conserved region domain-containing protein n=1 Tax=Amphilophus citrinellus TaxID=61819 RepID=A0A3Q0SXW8_AMPCI